MPDRSSEYSVGEYRCKSGATHVICGQARLLRLPASSGKWNHGPDGQASLR